MVAASLPVKMSLAKKIVVQAVKRTSENIRACGVELFDVAGMDKDTTGTLSMSFYEGEQFLRCSRIKMTS
jgi:hypothetical protein